jgi:hypothetical protein
VELPARIVQRDAQRSCWTVVPTLGSEPTAETKTKALAVAAATDQLRALESGGRLRVHYSDGRLEFDRLVTTSGAPPRPTPTVEGVARQIRAEGKTVDNGLDAGTKVLGALTYLGVPGLAAIVSPEVQSAAGKGWWAVFLATFTWSMGCTLATVVIKRSGLAGWPQAGAVGLCFVGALVIANLIGTGVLDVDSELAKAGNPIEVIIAFAKVAARTYGPVGALLGLGLGCWLGSRIAPLVSKDFLN